MLVQKATKLVLVLVCYKAYPLLRTGRRIRMWLNYRRLLVRYQPAGNFVCARARVYALDTYAPSPDLTVH